MLGLLTWLIYSNLWNSILMFLSTSVKWLGPDITPSQVAQSLLLNFWLLPYQLNSFNLLMASGLALSANTCKIFLMENQLFHAKYLLKSLTSACLLQMLHQLLLCWWSVLVPVSFLSLASSKSSQSQPARMEMAQKHICTSAAVIKTLILSIEISWLIWEIKKY